MFEIFEEYKERGIIVVIVVSMLAIISSGFFFGLTYFILDNVQTAFESTDCVIENNTLVSSCQELFELALYPFLELKDVLIWANIFFMFAFVLGMLVLGYQSGKKPILIGFLLIIVIVMTYVSIHVSNIYLELLENAVFRSLVIEFSVYNHLMIRLPWVTFIITLMSFILSLVNFQKSPTNSEELDY